MHQHDPNLPLWEKRAPAFGEGRGFKQHSVVPPKMQRQKFLDGVPPSFFGPATGAAVFSNCMSSGSKCGGRHYSGITIPTITVLTTTTILASILASNQPSNKSLSIGGCPRSALRPAHAQIWAIKSKHQSNAKAKTAKHTHKQHAQNVRHSLSPETLRTLLLLPGDPCRMAWPGRRVPSWLVHSAQSSTSRSSSLAVSLCPDAKMAQLAGKHVHRKGITRWGGDWRSNEKLLKEGAVHVQGCWFVLLLTGLPLWPRHRIQSHSMSLLVCLLLEPA